MQIPDCGAASWPTAGSRQARRCLRLQSTSEASSRTVRSRKSRSGLCGLHLSVADASEEDKVCGNGCLITKSIYSTTSVSVGLPGREKSSVTAALICPQVQITRHERSALIDPYGCRESHLPADPFQHLDDVGAAECKPRLQCRREPRERVDNREHTKLLFVGLVDESATQVAALAACASQPSPPESPDCRPKLSLHSSGPIPISSCNCRSWMRLDRRP